MSEEFGLIINNEHSLDENVHIDWNKDELLKYVRSITEKYDGRIYTDDDITDARTDRAELNALKNTISDGRIRVKKAIMAPYDRFEAEVAEVTNLIIEAVKPIDEAIKTHDENQKADKKKQLVAYFDSIIGDLAESVTFERVFDPKMANASTSMKKAKEGIADGVQQIRTNIETINTVVSEPYRSFAVANYLQTMKLAGSMKLAQRMEQEDRRKAELAAEAEKAKAATPAPAPSAPAAEPPKPAAPVQPAPQTSSFVAAAEKAAATTPAPAPAPAESPEKLYAMSFRAIGTKEQLMALRQYMKDNHIKYGKVD